ncbi:MAG: OB-fold domain-containing protein [Halieaceae bacterium]|nr:OB-fold domain-containing protein [Halieaceae bacterium]
MTEFFWEGARRGQLLILRCQSCGHYIHYPEPICSQCLSEDLTPNQVSGNAILYSYTISERAWHPFWVDKLPYALASVELPEQKGLRMATNIVDCPLDELVVGMELRVVFREVHEGLTLPLFTRQELQGASE